MAQSRVPSPGANDEDRMTFSEIKLASTYFVNPIYSLNALIIVELIRFSILLRPRRSNWSTWSHGKYTVTANLGDAVIKPCSLPCIHGLIW